MLFFLGVSPSTMSTTVQQQIQQAMPPALAGGASNEELDEFVPKIM